jgi:hypothetical protein
MTPYYQDEIRHAAQFRPGSVAVGAVVGRVQLRKELMMVRREMGLQLIARKEIIEGEGME